MKIEELKEQARRHEQREEWQKAFDLYTAALGIQDEEEPPDITLFNRVGDIQTRLGQINGAVEQYEKAVHRDDKRKGKTTDNLRKRFDALYKNLVFTDRAISGFNDLGEELKIKGEEIIHQLNQGSGNIFIKRKVFLKKGSNSILEILFGHKGRLYFRNTKNKRIEVLAIATKNTKTRELEFLAKL